MPRYDWEKRRRAEAYLALEDGSIFRGHSVGAALDVAGEAVFNTGMTGYQEILSDPSYLGQLVCLTTPEIGNYGVNAEDMESSAFKAAGLLVRHLNGPSNWRSEESLESALSRRGTPALAGLDTRALTLKLRERGSQKAFLCATGAVPPAEGVARARSWEGLDGRDYASRVTTPKAYAWNGGDGSLFPNNGFGGLPAAKFNVVAYDFGIKWSILRSLRQHGMATTVVPATTPAGDVLAMKPDGVFLSNGPGDPAAVGYAVETIRSLLGRVPLMGICLGHQLLGLACGGKTGRLLFGHHGCNHPVKDIATGRILVTSQNHNFAVEAESLPASRVDITHLSLNDGSVEGMRLRDAPAFSVQFHPEAGPGPHDALSIFEQFHKMMG